MKRPASHSFSQIPQANIPRSVFDRSHGHKTTIDAGILYPIFVDEVLPGDTINLNANVFARLATPIVPAMDNLYMDLFFFAVPLRLVWSNFQRFMGEQDNPSDSTDFTIPIISSGASGFEAESIYDYMGLPVGVPNLEVNVLPLRAYKLIYHEWFRHQDLQASTKPPTSDGPDGPATYALLRRNKRHDYFTSALPWPQKGEGVNLPLAESIEVVERDVTRGPGFTYGGGLDVDQELQHSGSSTQVLWGDGAQGAAPLHWADPNLMVEATSVTINALRQAFQLQKLMERDARGGTRYTEILRSHFGVISPDARLQRPEYLGGGTIPVNIHPVPQTSATGTYADSPQGNLAAFGTAAGRGAGFSKSFVEHSIVIGLVSVRADLNYQQGLHRMWTRQTKWDFYWPALAHIGEQAILNEEIYAQDGNLTDIATGEPYNKGVFGYNERWSEYRYAPSKITGQFRSSFPQPLDVWHYAQDFVSLPGLGPLFMEENPDIDRTIATPASPHFLLDAYFKVKHARPMPTYSVPGYIDHF